VSRQARPQIKIGVLLPQFTGDANDLVDGARRAEAAGLDSVWVFDHLWPLGARKDAPILEAWTSLAFVAAATERVSIGTLVTRSSLRHPVVLAKMAATLGAIAPGRLIVGIGSGDSKSRRENDAFGLPYWEPPDGLAQLASTVGLLRDYLHRDEISIEDPFSSVSALRPSPRPEPPPAVWVGGSGSSPGLMRLAGEAADGYNAWAVSPDRFGTAVAIVTEAAGGRTIEMTWAGEVVLGSDDADARRRLGNRDPARYIAGSPAVVAEALGAYVRAGAGHLILSLPTPAEPGLYELLAAEVVPVLRAGFARYPPGV